MKIAIIGRPFHIGIMARHLRVEYPGAIYHVSCRMVGDAPSSAINSGLWPASLKKIGGYGDCCNKQR